jgi:hypothetical protein
MKDFKQLNSKLTKYLDEFNLSCSDDNLVDLKSDLINFRDNKDQATKSKIQSKFDLIGKPYSKLATLFTTSTNQYVYNLMPELSSIGDIRHCLIIDDKYSNILNKLCQTVVSSLSKNSQSKILIDEKLSLIVFIEILNSILIVIDSIVRNVESIPTTYEVENYITNLVQEERKHLMYNLQDSEKLIDKYLKLLDELDTHTI